MRRLALLAAVALPLLAHADAPKPAAPVVVPFELLPSRHMAVQATVNGKGPYKLIFDTGAPILLVNSKLAREADIKGKGKGGLMGFGAVPDAKIRKLELGALTAADVPTVVMDHPTVAAISEMFGPIDGLIGFPFFARYATAIDYQKKELTLTPNGYQPVDLMKSLTDTLTANAGKKGGKREKPGPRILVPAGQWGLEVAKADGDEAAGVDVTRVAAGGAATAAGLRVGDRVLTVDGRWTDSVADLFAVAAEVSVGQAVRVTLRRAGRDVEVTLTPSVGL